MNIRGCIRRLALILAARLTELTQRKAEHLAILFHILHLIPHTDEPINFLQADEVPYYTHR